MSSMLSVLDGLDGIAVDSYSCRIEVRHRYHVEWMCGQLCTAPEDGGGERTKRNEDTLSLYNRIRAQRVRAEDRVQRDRQLALYGTRHYTTPPRTRRRTHNAVRDVHDAIAQAKEVRGRQRLREEISEVVHRGDEGHADFMIFHSLTHEEMPTVDIQREDG